jgi:hypothetical protein
MIKVIGQDDNGIQYLIDVNSISGSNVVILNVTCDLTVYVGAAVIMDGSGVAQNALADSKANSNVIGIVEAKSDTTTCDIRVLGVSASIFSGLDVTKEYYLSNTVPGQITTTVPATTGHVKAKLGQPFSATEMLVLKGERTIRG